MTFRALFFAPLALVLAMPAAAQVVETGKADWDRLPPARIKGDLDYQKLSRWAEQVVESKACRDAGWRPERFRVDEPFAVLLEPDGTVKRIVIAETSCPGIDYVVGLHLQALSEAHRFRPTGTAAARWYGGRVVFEVSPQAQ